MNIQNSNEYQTENIDSSSNPNTEQVLTEASRWQIIQGQGGEIQSQATQEYMRAKPSDNRSSSSSLRIRRVPSARRNRPHHRSHDVLPQISRNNSNLRRNFSTDSRDVQILIGKLTGENIRLSDSITA